MLVRIESISETIVFRSSFNEVKSPVIKATKPLARTLIASSQSVIQLVIVARVLQIVSAMNHISFQTTCITVSPCFDRRSLITSKAGQIISLILSIAV